MPPVLVDLFCNDLEVGKSVTMTDVGPTSAFLEHDRPLPVGAELSLHTGEGAAIGAVVVRVHESVTDAKRAAGMFVRVVEIATDSEKWWKTNIDSKEDPVFPTGAVVGSAQPVSTARTNTVDITPEELARMAAEDRTAASAAAPMPGPPPVDETAPNAGSAPKGKGKSGGSGVNTTVKMTADQVKAITDTAKPEERNGTSVGMAVAVPPPEVAATESNAESKPKKKKRRRKKKS